MALALGCSEQPDKSADEGNSRAEEDDDGSDDGDKVSDDDEQDEDDGKSDEKDAGKASVDAAKPAQDASKPSVDSATPDAGKPPIDAGTPSEMDPPDTVATECLASANVAPGTTMNLMLNGRNYTLHIGKAVKVGTAAPLVMSLHGLSMTPASMESMARWHPLSDTEGFIVAGPAGVGSSNGWDLTGTKDFDLMKAVIDDVNKKACVDRKRVYSTGFSHGGFMSFANACKLPEVFAAVAPHSGAGTCRSALVRPMPIFTWHGDADPIVSYSSGKSSHDSWVMRDKCGEPTDFMIGSNKCQEWKGCTDDVPVKMCTIPGGGHMWSRDATRAIWDFFKGISMP